MDGVIEMFDFEKINRCEAITPDTKHGRVPGCSVYGRNIGSCEDCAFSVLARPKMLQKYITDRGD